MAKRLTLEEQELLISINGRADRYDVYTSYPHWIKRLDKYCDEYPNNWKIESVETLNGEIVSKAYSCDKDMIRLISHKRKMSDEQKEAAARRLAEYRKQAGKQ